MAPRRIDYIIERMGAHGWFAEALPFDPARRFPNFYLVGCGVDKNIIKRLWFYGFDESDQSVELKCEIIDQLFESTKDLPAS